MNYIVGDIEQSVQDARFDAKKLARLADYYANLVATGRVQAAGFLLARNGKTFANQCIGRLSNQPGREKAGLKPDSIKRLASLSKVIAATAVMQLVEDGRIWLEQPVATIIPEFNTDMHKGINLWHLLTHTSGLPADGGYFSDPYPVDRHALMRSPEWLKKGVLCGPLQSKPGANWNYSTVAFAVLGEVVARVSGQSYGEYLDEHIFRPLGMDRSFMEVPAALHPEVVINAEWDSAALLQKSEPGLPPNAGGGVYSSMPDLNKFAQAFLNNGEFRGQRILSKKAVQEMTRNQLSGVPSYHWGKNCTDYRQGLGWGFYADGPTVGPATYNHEGWGWCSLFIDPVEDFVLISFVADSKDWDPVIMVNPRTIAFSGIL